VLLVLTVLLVRRVTLVLLVLLVRRVTLVLLVRRVTLVLLVRRVTLVLLVRRVTLVLLVLLARTLWAAQHLAQILTLHRCCNRPELPRRVRSLRTVSVFGGYPRMRRQAHTRWCLPMPASSSRLPLAV
jgi:hypothetical protein